MKITFGMSLMTYAFCLLGCEQGPGVSRAWLAAEVGLEELKQRVVRDSLVYNEGLSADLLVFKTLSKTRFTPDYIAEFIVVDETTRKATFAAKYDGWPLEIGIEIRRTAKGWSIAEFTNRQAIRNSLSLLSESGLPNVTAGTPWAGGLMGRDDQGRPNSAVLIRADGDAISIDGRPFRPYLQNEAIEIIKTEISARRRAATEAFSTYRPHTAIALASHTPVQVLQELVTWSTQAGAESIQLLARSENGPVWLPLAVIALGEQSESNWRLSLSPKVLYLQDYTHSKPVQIGGSLSQVRPLLNALDVDGSNGGMRKGLIIDMKDQLDYRSFIDWLAHLHRQRPALRIGLAEQAR